MGCGFSKPSANAERPSNIELITPTEAERAANANALSNYDIGVRNRRSQVPQGVRPRRVGRLEEIPVQNGHAFLVTL